MKDQLESPSNSNNSMTIRACFFVFELLSYMSFVVIVAGAQDILAASEIQTSTIVLLANGPYTFVTFVLPYFAKRIPYSVRFGFGSLSLVSSFALLGLAHDAKWMMFGVVLESFGAGVIDVSSIALTSYFDELTLSAFMSGSGVGSFIGPVYYTAMTTWFCVSPNVTFLILAPLFLFYFLGYYLIQKEISRGDCQLPGKRQEVSYTKVHSSDDEDAKDGMEKEKAPNKAETMASGELLTWREQLVAAKKLTVLVGITTFIAFFAEYVLYQGVVTTIAYSNSPFPPRDHYQYYSLALMIGEVLGRSHRSLIGAINRKWLYTPTVKGLWALTIFEAFLLIFLFFESWYRFLPGVGIVIFICFTAGLTIGVLFCYVYEIVRVTFEEKEQEFALGFAFFPINIGVIIASMLALYVEPRLKEHCIFTLKDSSYCFTRMTHSKHIVAACKLK